ncbi:MAG: hypothetical protein MUC96_02655 [Myxococcaceae bacterium]|nr:hypothetical protein [Myxococcaceae bacterium]
MKVLRQNDLYRFELDGAVLAFRWTERTAQMSEQDFKDALVSYAGCALEHRPRGLLIDTRAFQYPRETPGAWRDEHIVPLYREAGAHRMAYVLPVPAGNAVPPPRAQHRFDEAFFADEPSAVAWLCASGA